MLADPTGSWFSRLRSLLLALQAQWAQALSPVPAVCWRAWAPKAHGPPLAGEVGLLVLDGLLVPAAWPGGGCARRPSSAASWCNRRGAGAPQVSPQVLLAVSDVTAYEAKEEGCLRKALKARDLDDPERGLGVSEKGRGIML